MSQRINIDDLIDDAVQDGDVDLSVKETLTKAKSDIQRGMGLLVDEYMNAEVKLVTLLIDDSGSMRNVVDVVMEGHAMILDALKASKDGANDKVLVATILLNQGVISEYKLLSNADALDNSNYGFLYGKTPLYRQSINALGTAQLKAKEFENEGVSCTTWTLIMTDGYDNSGQKPDKIRELVNTMIRAEIHEIIGMGIVDDDADDFRETFKGMGIREDCILTAKNTASEIRRAFRAASQSASALNKIDASAIGGFAS